MCGIMGIWNKNGADASLLKKGIKIMNYRGPDQKGFYEDKYVALGHCRLSIIDLSNKGKQPLSNEDGSLWITYNGEIYNYLNLKQSLEQKGHKLFSHTDTEVIIHLYEEYGEDCVKFLDGMFAFGIWDSNTKSLFLARDRIGKKPLYYYLSKDKLIFASEIKAILQDKSIKREINPQALSNYVTYGYVPYPNTIFKNIFELPPSSVLLKNKNNATIKQYWSINFNQPKIKNENEAQNLILKQLKDSVQKRLMSDVPLGVFLSGGIDSSAVVALMSKNLSQEVKTFSIGFKEQDYDETKYSQFVAEKFGTDHYEKIIEPDAIKILPKLVWHFDQPFFDFTAIPTYYLAQMAKKKVTVALNGDGGDELFAGYPKYVNEKILNNIPKFLSAIPIFKNLSSVAKINRVVHLLQQNRYERYISLSSVIDNKIKSLILKDNIVYHDSKNILLDEFQKCEGTHLEKWLYSDIKKYLPCQLIPKVERTCMAHSLEPRSPFLDYKLVELTTQIHPSLKLRGLTTKYILKKSLKGILPKEIIWRKKKGFGVPVGDWLKKDLKFMVDNIINKDNKFMKSYFHLKEIKKLVEQHNNGFRDHTSRIWSLIMLNEWYEYYYLKFLS